MFALASRRSLKVLAAALAAALALSCAAQRAAAQAYPTRPVTVIVPFAAGGGNDILARLLTQHMGKALGQQFVIENRPGAGGTIGARARRQGGARRLHADGRPFRRVRRRAGALCRSRLCAAARLLADRAHRLVSAGPGRAPVGADAHRRRPHRARAQGPRQDHLCHGGCRLRLASLDRAVRGDGEHQAHPRAVSRHRRDAGRSRRRPCRHVDHDVPLGVRAVAQRRPAPDRGDRRDALADLSRPADHRRGRRSRLRSGDSLRHGGAGRT